MSANATVAVFTAEEWHNACAHLRVRSPLRAAGMRVIAGFALPDAQLNLNCIAQADVVLIQRDFPRFADAYRQVLQTARMHGKPVVFDIDDALWDLPVDHPAHDKYVALRKPILRAIADADLVTASTDTLRDRLRHINPNVVTLPNCIDENLWTLPHVNTPQIEHAPVIIGYMGGGTHKPDLDMIAPALQHIAVRYGNRVQWQFFGDHPPDVLKSLPNTTHQAHMPDYGACAAWLQKQTWDIALAPLRDTPFNHHKSSIKFMEYACLPAAVVSSDVVPYHDAIDPGVNGVLVKEIEAWEAAISTLIEQPALRRKISLNAQRTVQARHLLANNAHAWREAYEQAAALAKTPRKALPTVSVIVLNHNGRQHLQGCFDSLEKLDYAPNRIELVLADNGSTDDSIAFTRQAFPDVRILAFEHNLGFCAGYNRAIADCTSDCIALLNNDMRVLTDWLAHLTCALQSEPDVVCAGAKILKWDGTALDFAGHLFSPLGHARGTGYGESSLAAHDDQRYLLAASAGSMLIRRDVFLQVGGFDEKYFAYFEDLDLGWRLWIMGYKVIFAPKAIAFHHHFSTSSRIPAPQIAHLYERNTLCTLIKNYEQPYLDKVLPVALMMRIKHAYLSAQQAGLNMEHVRLKPGELRDAPKPRRYNAGYYAREAARTLKQDGLTGVLRKVLDEIDTRRGRKPPRSLQNKSLLQARLQSADINDLLNQDAFWHAQAQLAAVDDVITHYDELMVQRAGIQAQRKCSDALIFSMTRAATLEPWFESPEYARAHNTLFEAFKLAQLFTPASPDTTESTT